MRKPARTVSRSRARGGFLLGVFVGLVLGLGIALGVAFYLNRTPIPFLAKAKPSAAKDAADAARTPGLAGLPPQGAAASGSAEKPKFDFYKILPGGEEPVSDRELKEAARAAKGQAEAGKEIYYIQAGSFQSPADADNQKARLAILGIDSSIEAASVADEGTLYRVRLGPYRSIEELNRVRQMLAQNGIDANLVKQKTN